MAVTIEFLSASSSGQGIQIANTSPSGTIIHSGVAGTTQKDEVFLYANNTGSGAYPLVLEVGGTGSANRVFYNIAPQDGYTLIYPGFPANNSLVFRGYSPSGANLFIVNGYAQRGP